MIITSIRSIDDRKNSWILSNSDALSIVRQQWSSPVISGHQKCTRVIKKCH